MKIRNLILLAAVVLMAAALVGCASSGGSSGSSSSAAALPPVPEGAERLSLDNGTFAIFRFDLPAGAKWSNYNKLTADYMIDEANLKKKNTLWQRRQAYGKLHRR